MTNNVLASQQKEILKKIKNEIFIELIPTDSNFINIYSYPLYNQKNSQNNNIQPTIGQSFIHKIDLNELGDALNNFGRIRKVTLMLPNKEFCRKKLYQLVEVIEDSGTNYQIFFHFKHNHNYLSYTLEDIKAIVPIDEIDAIKEDDTDYSINNIKCEGINYTTKRLIDITVSAVLLIALSPFLIGFAILIRYYSGNNSILYKPTRVGKHGKPFKMYKLKSMYEDDYTGLKSTVKNDARITPIGKFIRRRNIDELPQLYNVLKGDMSLVGPRPHRIFLSESLHGEVPNYSIRYLVKPGITGWAQANGWRGPTDTEIQKKQRAYHDIFYVGNWNIFFDIKIMFMTVLGKKVKNNAF